MIQGQLLHPFDLVVGQWDVNLHRRDVHLLESIVFPPISCSKQDYCLSNSAEKESKGWDKHKKSKLQCKLILDKDGTFSLQPPIDLCYARTDGMLYHLDRTPLKGRWELRPNPYCVTDRQYDELTLISNPKTRYNINSKMSKDVEEVVTLEMNCKVWGRFGSNTIRHLLKRPRGRDAAKMTHGSLCIRKDTIGRGGHDQIISNGTPNSRTAICATFNAKTF